ncbi:glycoside hydrolase family protein [Bradyrhizobium sp. Ec3.3]|uniref:glycoside hydrolase family protein n=1 Tax=Bradyrhizobium sp. Ec3.3 TaxID=189753 RepID=UPI00042683AB|nr:peptidoglycan-binding protein [Bradyrhizobium sp. Ec3.3]
MDATEQGLAVIRSFEGRALKAYRDSVGVWTIGYGNTNFDAFAVQFLGQKIGAGLTITEEQAEFLLRESLSRNYAPAVAKAMPNAKPNENDAGLSFHYNTGAVGRAGWVARWRDKAADAAIRAGLMSWNKAGGKVLNGLTRRRAREADIILKGDYGPEGRTKPPVLNADGRVIKSSEPDHPLAGTPGMLRKGDTGPDVTDLNDALEALGFRIPDHTTFGDATEQAVLRVQTSHPQLSVDGIVGPATRAVINREADMKRKVANTVKTGGAGGVATAAADAVSGGGVPAGVYIIVGVVALVVIGYFAWKYRDEITAMAKR